MPIDSTGVGYSDHTSEKQEAFAALVSVHLQMAWGAAVKYQNPRYYYFDLSAGPGCHDRYGDGSPLLFCAAAERMADKQPAFKYSALMVDRNAQNVARLQRELDARRYYNAAAVCEEAGKVLRQYAVGRYGTSFGLFYLDPTLPADMPWRELAYCSQFWKRADILIHVPAASFKRVQHLDGRQPLREHLASIDKTRMCIMEPADKHQWTFFYLTNGKPLVWKKRGFHDVDSRTGQRIWDVLTKTANERRNDGYSQPRLF